MAHTDLLQCGHKALHITYRPPPPHPTVTTQIPKTQAGTGDNHAISSMKFEILEEFLTLGWSVLLRCEERGMGWG